MAVATLQLFSASNKAKILSEEKYIISSCVISNNCIVKTNRNLFSSTEKNVQSFFAAAYQYLKLDYPKFYKMDNFCKLGLLASEVLLKDELIVQQFQPHEIGIVLMNAHSSLDTDIKYFQSTKDIASPALFVYTLPNIVMGEMCIRNNFKGENAFFVSEGFNADFLKQYVEDLFNTASLQLCICGWIDVMNEDYKTVLFLVSNIQHEQLLFTTENLNKIFESA